jgi:predicted ATPase/DNA-binding CsgD family transcriptional regulator
VTGGAHGFPAALTSFVGRAGPVREVGGLLEQHRLVTVTGPGGVGKTRVAGQVARRVAARFADGAWLAELALVQDPAQVPVVVAAVLGVQEQPGVPVAEVLARVLARQQLLLVLDNCEHLIGAAAELCARLLAACDDMRVLATSREPLRAAGEVRYRLGPLALPDPGSPADVGGSEAVSLFVDRAHQVDAGFVLDGQTGPMVAQLVAGLDGMPLAIELAAARVEALGVMQLADRLGDRFALLTAGDRLAAGRHRSLAAAMEWSYRLLNEDERRVFRAVSVFPGPFTLEAAEAVAGAGAGPVALRLVDCSLLVPPHAGPDHRSRYGMLETLRVYGAWLLEQADEADRAAAALAGYALRVAEQAGAGLQTINGEVAAARWLDAEDATVRQGLAWAMQHDPHAGLRIMLALAPWWLLRGRLASQYNMLREAAVQATPGSTGWCAARYWLGFTAFSLRDLPEALGHFTAVQDAVGDRGPSRALADCLAERSLVLSYLGRIGEAIDTGHRAIVMARELGDPAGEALALVQGAIVALNAGDFDDGLQLASQAQQITAGIPGWIARSADNILTAALIQAGDLAAAERNCAAGLTRSRDAGDLGTLVRLLVRMATLDRRAGRIKDAAAHLREALQIGAQAGFQTALVAALDSTADLCAATGRYAEEVTVWAAAEAVSRYKGYVDPPSVAGSRDEPLIKARHALGPVQARAAQDRGAAMSLDIAVEYALMLTAPEPSPAAKRPGKLSAREQELVTLVAQGRTNAQIAAELYISIRTVSSHLDRIRDKTGCRRRADLTRLALTTGLV